LNRLHKEHESREKELNMQIDELKNTLDAVKKSNLAEETKLTGSYQAADNAYSDVLDTYDTEMRDYERQKDNAKKAYDEEA